MYQDIYNIPKSTLSQRALRSNKTSAHGNILFTALFAATNNEVMITL